MRIHRTAVAEAEAEAAESLCLWSVASLAGMLSLDNILSVLACGCLALQCGVCMGLLARMGVHMGVLVKNERLVPHVAVAFAAVCPRLGLHIQGSSPPARLCLAPQPQGAPAGVLLERQVVFFCPKIGLLTTAVLAMIPMLRPFAWQSMIMPVLPAHESMLHLLDAPVPFLLGLQVMHCPERCCSSSYAVVSHPAGWYWCA